MDLAALRNDMVAALRERQHVGEPVAAAMRAVPRHLFVPGVGPEVAYRDEPIVTKHDEHGTPISSSSQPAIMAAMLDQLDVRPGHRVLEIGAGTGYNAALLARLAGPGGRVVSVDIDPDIAARASSHLSAAGASEVEVVCADGALGHPPLAPYDRVIATVGVWDLAPAWLEQLAPAGRLVVPLDLRGVQASVALERAEGCWESVSVVPCGFMRMRGPSAGTEVLMAVRRDPELMLTLPEPREVGDVAAALDAAPTEIATGVSDHAPPYLAGQGVWLWLALHEPRWCALSGRLEAGYGASAGIVGTGGIALLVMRDGALVVRGHGPGGARLAADLAGHVRAWDAAGRPEAGTLRVRAWQGPAPVDGAAIIEKRHTTLALSFA
ncbi:MULTISPECIES: methyltransferase, FxLD system [unclassified Nonomuraea]|uniref:methyltransferase, FxLD system n=1 Tax=unclassified Nonomuraea TaxID=2593643 RepID=UPI001376FA06|nr:MULTISPECIES: methyltransferase, FxLD system [unclassified Nonomuraea]NBE94758.1 methyltransferase, FxLD system [Nonomuraea sp. K271]